VEVGVLKNMHERIVKNFMDIIVLAELRNNSLSGYDVISYVHDKVHLLVSSGTVHSLLYSMERKGLIEGKWTERKRVYKLTDKGERTIDSILNANDKIQLFLSQLLSAKKAITA